MNDKFGNVGFTPTNQLVENGAPKGNFAGERDVNPLRRYPPNRRPCFCGRAMKAKNCCLPKMPKFISKSEAAQLNKDWHLIITGKATISPADNAPPNVPAEEPTPDPQDISDGYHTFRELYDHRCLLYIALVLHSPWKKAWKPHHPGWPVLFLETPAGQIGYHVKEVFLPMFEGLVPRIDDYIFDGHTSADVVERLQLALAKHLPPRVEVG